VRHGPNRQDRTSREALYREAADAHGAAIARLAAAYEADPAERADLEQTIHLELWRSLASFAGRSSLRTWVFRVAHNVAASHADAGRRRRGMMADTAPDEIDAESAEPPPDEQVARAEMLATLHALIRGLTATDRQVMLLYLEELDAGAIAEITGLTAGAVATRISRVKEILKTRFEAGGQ
jgi:RNA polymerase sigma-70 factor (ECF subfamily)